ncbi:MAG: CBS domain-containing protein [Nitrospirota bacterium]
MEKRKDKKVSDVYLYHSTFWEISPYEEAIKALEVMIKNDVGRLVVKENDSITGLITRNGLARYVQIMGK